MTYSSSGVLPSVQVGSLLYSMCGAQVWSYLVAHMKVKWARSQYAVQARPGQLQLVEWSKHSTQHNQQPLVLTTDTDQHVETPPTAGHRQVLHWAEMSVVCEYGNM